MAYNLGLGTRVLTPGESWAFGANVFYDYRASARKLHTHQISPGIEVLSKYFDIRASGYFPVGGYKHSDDLKFHRFVGNHLEKKQRILTSYKSVSAEVGAPIPGSFSRKIDFYAAAGPYYLFQRTVTGVTCKSALGGQVRLSAKILSGIYIEADTHFDRVYHWNGSGSISFHFPLGKKPKRNNSKTSTAQQALARRVHERPIRNEIIPMCKSNR